MSHSPQAAFRLRCPFMGGNCIADSCAMWRWTPTSKSVPVEIEGAGGSAAVVYQQKETKEVGYCGLAGKID